MRRQASYILLVLPLAGLRAQDRVARPTTSCVAAEVALGPESSAQAKAELHRSYSPQTDRTYLHFSTDEFLAANGFSALVSWPGQGNPEGLSAQLSVSVPKDLLASPITETDTLVLVDDSVRLSLGIPTPATMTGPRIPRFVPLSVPLRSESFLSIAMASSISIQFRGKSFKASKEVRSGLIALYRAMACALASP